MGITISSAEYDSVVKMVTNFNNNLSPKAEKMFQTTEKTMSELRLEFKQTLQESNQMISELRPKVQQTVQDAHKMISELRPEVKQMVQGAHKMISELRPKVQQTVQDAHKMISELRPKVQQTVQDAHKMISELRPEVEQTLQGANEMMVKIGKVCDDTNKVVNTVDTKLESFGPLFCSIGAVIDAVDKIPPKRKVFAFKFIVLIVFIYYSCYPLVVELIGPWITETTIFLAINVHTFLMHIFKSLFYLGGQIITAIGSFFVSLFTNVLDFVIYIIPLVFYCFSTLLITVNAIATTLLYPIIAQIMTFVSNMLSPLLIIPMDSLSFYLILILIYSLIFTLVVTLFIILPIVIVKNLPIDTPMPLQLVMFILWCYFLLLSTIISLT